MENYQKRLNPIFTVQQPGFAEFGTGADDRSKASVVVFGLANAGQDRRIPFRWRDRSLSQGPK
jgi:hypothetical protein